jgi:predicted nuclease of predicted toxin-antitoxin system
MILADENINAIIIEAIRDTGIEVYSIDELHEGIKDEKVIDLSRSPRRIILTEDKDFGEWVFAHGVKDISVILLRYQFPETNQMIHILSDLLGRKNLDLFGKFAVG